MAEDRKEQFGRIYDEYIDKIYRFAYLKVNSKEIAEDITSKVFTNGWEAHKNQNGLANPGAFLYKTARNAVIDYYREKGKTRIVPIDNIAPLSDQKERLGQRAEINADIELVKSAIQNLKKDYQDVLIWHYLDDVPVPEIANIMGKPEGTIRVMLHRGLKEVRENMIQGG